MSRTLTDQLISELPLDDAGWDHRDVSRVFTDFFGSDWKTSPNLVDIARAVATKQPSSAFQAPLGAVFNDFPSACDRAQAALASFISQLRTGGGEGLTSKGETLTGSFSDLGGWFHGSSEHKINLEIASQAVTSAIERHAAYKTALEDASRKAVAEGESGIAAGSPGNTR